MSDGLMLMIGKDGVAREYKDDYDIVIHCESKEEQDKVWERINATAPNWIPVMDGDGQMPEVDEEGYSEYILLSFSNASSLCIGQYREDENGGAFFDGDDEDPLTKLGLVVNAWMPLPEPYKEEM